MMCIKSVFPTPFIHISLLDLPIIPLYFPTFHYFTLKQMYYKISQHKKLKKTK